MKQTRALIIGFVLGAALAVLGQTVAPTGTVVMPAALAGAGQTIDLSVTLQVGPGSAKASCSGIIYKNSPATCSWTLDQPIPSDGKVWVATISPPTGFTATPATQTMAPGSTVIGPVAFGKQ